MDDLLFRAILAALLIAFVLHRGYYTRKVQHAPDAVLVQPKPGIATQIGNLLAIPALLSAVVYVIVPGWLSWAVLPISDGLRWLSVGVSVAGFALLQWAQQTLGAHWSDTPRLVAGQEMIARGPYRWIRHPIYAAFLLVLGPLGLISANGLVGGLWIAMASLGIASRIRTEEAMMLARFGEQYRAYMRRTGRLLPRIARRQGTEP